jgi:hypothetical protein
MSSLFDYAAKQRYAGERGKEVKCGSLLSWEGSKKSSENAPFALA